MAKSKSRAKTKTRISAKKARQILRDNSAQGHPLTSKQKRFGAIAGGAKPRRG